MVRNLGLGVALGVALAAPAAAQTESAGAPTAAAAQTEIVVTARRAQERLQDVPLSITALDANAIAEAGIADLRDVAAQTPNLTFDDLVGGLFSAPVIRGLSQSNTFGPRNVATFLDGVYISDSAAVDFGIFDLERVEVVKGPQSALYGRNSFAGAINYVTQKPSDTFRAWGEVEAGSDGKARVAGSISGPLIEGLLSARAAIGYDEFDGTWESPRSGVKMGGFEKTGGSLAVRFTPTASTTIDLRGYWADDTINPSAIDLVPFNCGAGAGNYFCGKLPDGDDGVVIESTASRYNYGTKRDLALYSASLEQDIGQFTLSGHIGHNSVEIDSYNDYDRTEAGEVFFTTSAGGPGTVRLNSYTGLISDTEETEVELRFGDQKNEVLRWAVGGFYYTGETASGQPFGIDATPVPAGATVTIAPALRPLLTDGARPGQSYTRSVTGTDQWSMFATADWSANERITLRGEVRYTEIESDVDIPFNTFVGGRPAASRASAKWSFTNYRVSGDYRITPDNLVYASVATGTNAGGFNTGALGGPDLSYQPEDNTTYEIGTKNTFFNRRLTANLALFLIDWQDAQINGPPTAPGALVNVVRNFGEIESKGFELDLAWRATDQITLGLGYGLADAEFGANAYDAIYAVGRPQTPAVAACLQQAWCAPRVKTFTGPNGANFIGISLDGLPTPRTSREKLVLSADAEAPVTDQWRLFGRADYTLEGPQFLTPNGLQKTGQRDTLNVRLGVRSDTISLTGYVENALDDLSPSTAIQNQASLSTFAPIINSVYPNGRRYGVVLRVSY